MDASVVRVDFERGRAVGHDDTHDALDRDVDRATRVRHERPERNAIHRDDEASDDESVGYETIGSGVDEDLRGHWQVYVMFAGMHSLRVDVIC